MADGVFLKIPLFNSMPCNPVIALDTRIRLEYVSIALNPRLLGVLSFAVSLH